MKKIIVLFIYLVIFTNSFSQRHQIEVGAGLLSSNTAKDKEIVGMQNIDYYTLSGEATFYYMNRENIRMYGLLGAGITIAKQKDHLEKTDYSENRTFNYLNLH